jgi:hypothetical protein
MFTASCANDEHLHKATPSVFVNLPSEAYRMAPATPS